MANFSLRNHGRSVAMSVRVRARLDIVEVDLPKAIGSPPTDPPEMQHPRLSDHFRCERLTGSDKVIPPNSESRPYEVILGGESGMASRAHSFLSDQTFAALTVEWDEKQGPDIEISLHIVVDYRDTTTTAYTSESVWLWWPGHEGPESAGHFEIAQYMELTRDS